MIEIKNEQIFGEVVAKALIAAETNPRITSGERYRWINAIKKAIEKFADLSYQMEWMTEEQHLLVWSDSLEIYEANGTCTCKAYVEFGQPCWHRAMARLIKNYLAAENQPPQVKGAAATPAPASISSRDMINAPYLKTASNKKTETFGGVRV